MYKDFLVVQGGMELLRKQRKCGLILITVAIILEGMKWVNKELPAKKNEIGNKTNTVVWDETEMRSCWKEYFGDLYKTDMC